MARKIIRFTPDQMGYKDRGKMKWLGLMLSDHAEALNQMMLTEKTETFPVKPRQALTEISRILAEAYNLKRPIAIQPNRIQDGLYAERISCLVSGTFDNQIYLVSKDNRVVVLSLEEIRHVEFIEPNSWFQKQ